VYYIHILYGFFENLFKERVEEEQKVVFALLAGECFFEGEVQSKRSELRLFLADIASRYFGHIYPRKNKSYNKVAPLKGNIEKRLNQDLCPLHTKLNEKEFAPTAVRPCQTLCSQGYGKGKQNGKETEK
jgi:hypothetical protein